MKTLTLSILSFLMIVLTYGQIGGLKNEINSNLSVNGLTYVSDSLLSLGSQNPGDNKTSLTAKDFFINYNIDPVKSYFGKVLNESTINAEPFCNSEKYDVKIPQGETILVYKYLNGEGGCWAIKYKDFYGFIRNTGLMPIKNNAGSKSNFTKCDSPPGLITLIRPKYPKEARKRNIKGSVILKAFVNTKGVVEEVKISEGIKGLNKSAINAVKKARFKPAKYRGEKVPAWISLSIDFE